jgi:hypothetical protein
MIDRRGQRFPATRKGGTFATKLDLKNYTSINQKTVFGTRNPAFFVGAVCGSFS